MYWTCRLKMAVIHYFSVFIWVVCSLDWVKRTGSSEPCIRVIVYCLVYCSKVSCQNNCSIEGSFWQKGQLTSPRTPRIGGLKSQVLKPYFSVKDDGEKWSRFFYFETLLAPSELLPPSAGRSAQKG